MINSMIKCILRLMDYLFHWLLLPIIIITCLLARICKKKIHIGLGPLPMINNVYWAAALRKKGFLTETFVTDCYSITDTFDWRFDKGIGRLLYYVPFFLFVFTIFRFKCVYVYFNGGPLMTIPGIRLLEPLLYRMAGIKTVVMPYGNDCQIFERTPNKTTAAALCQDYPQFFKKNHKKIVRQVEAWSKGANIVVGAMDSIDYLYYWDRIRHCHYAIDTEMYQPQYPIIQKGQTIKILHAPNHKAIKGSSAVIQAVEALQAEGYAIELIFKQGVPNHEFLEMVKQADIVIDQLIMGWYAMFALEAMSLGKPTICYIREDLSKVFENMGCIQSGEIPLINAELSNITEVLRSLLNRPEQLTKIGEKSRAYCVKYHSLEAVGAFFDEINQSIGIQPQNKQRRLLFPNDI